MSVIDKLKKRRKYPIEIQGEKVFVRALLPREKREIELTDGYQNEEWSIGFTVGCGLLNGADEPCFDRKADESPEEFGRRIILELDDAEVPTDTRAQIAATVIRLAAGPTPEQIKALEKN